VQPGSVSCWTAGACVAVGFRSSTYGAGASRLSSPRELRDYPSSQVFGSSWGQSGGVWGSVGTLSGSQYLTGVSCVAGTCTVLGLNDAGLVVATMTTLLGIMTTSLPVAPVGSVYHQNIGVWGGGETVSFAVTAGSLPAGITLDGVTGVLSGTPTTMGTYSFTVTATSPVDPKQSTSLTYTLTVGALAATGVPLLPLAGSGLLLLALGALLVARQRRLPSFTIERSR